MSKQIIFATNNKHKLKEMNAIAPAGISFIGLKEKGITEDIPETGKTFEENALIKARFIVDKYNLPCISEDSGLSVNALGGSPGIYSARYAGENATAIMNNNKLLDDMEGQTDRSATFISVIAFIENGKEMTFRGECNGYVHTDYLGPNGFGYDPIFIPKGYAESFAELGDQVKNLISHRRKSFDSFINYLNP